MKMFFKCLISSLALSVATSVNAEEATGNVAMIQVPTNNDLAEFYFEISPMPAGVTQAFYIRHEPGDAAGCTVTGNEKKSDRAYTALLTAKATAKSVNLRYCIDNNGYGLVNGRVRVNP